MRVAGVAIFLGIWGDALLRAAPWGLNLPLWTATVLVSAVLLSFWHGEDLRWPRLLILSSVLVFAAGFMWRDSAALKALDLLTMLVAISVWTLSLEDVKVGALGILDLVRGFVNSAAAAAFGAIRLTGPDITRELSTSSPRLKQARSFVLGLLIAVPLLFVFGGLLMAADAVFDQMVSTALDFDFASLFSHATFAALLAWIVCGFFLLITRVVRPDLSSSFTIERPGLGIVEVAVPLLLIDVLFLAFVLVQLRYLFGDTSLVQSTVGLTYSDYARRGFFELVAVAALVLPLLLASDWVLSESEHRKQRLFRILAGLQISLLFVIMVSAVKRMLLYQSAYGLTELRFYSTAFMAWLGVVLVWFAATVLRGQRGRFVAGAVVTGLLLVAGLNTLNPDALIARVNTQRAADGAEFDAYYASSLSGDAVATLLSELPELSEADRCVVATRLLQRWSEPAPMDWRSWNRGRVAAWRAVREAAPRLEKMDCDDVVAADHTGAAQVSRAIDPASTDTVDTDTVDTDTAGTDTIPPNR
jgi:hypothetical protein